MFTAFQYHNNFLFSVAHEIWKDHFSLSLSPKCTFGIKIVRFPNPGEVFSISSPFTCIGCTWWYNGRSVPLRVWHAWQTNDGYESSAAICPVWLCCVFSSQTTWHKYFPLASFSLTARYFRVPVSGSYRVWACAFAEMLSRQWVGVCV